MPHVQPWPAGEARRHKCSSSMVSAELAIVAARLKRLRNVHAREERPGILHTVRFTVAHPRPLQAAKHPLYRLIFPGICYPAQPRKRAETAANARHTNAWLATQSSDTFSKYYLLNKILKSSNLSGTACQETLCICITSGSSAFCLYTWCRALFPHTPSGAFFPSCSKSMLCP